MAQKYTEARKEGNRRWDAANLDRLSVAVPKGKKDQIKAHAEARGESVNAFINRAIDETIEREE
jgi:predicted HicB family RNase H-like nuclease